MCSVVLSCRGFGLFAELYRFVVVAAKLDFCGIDELNRVVVVTAKLAFCGIYELNRVVVVTAKLAFSCGIDSFLLLSRLNCMAFLRS